MSNIHQGHRSRLRETAEKTGLDKMQQHQALELLLTYVIPQKDVNPLAHSLINRFGSFSGVLDAKKQDLLKVKGVGETTAHFLSTFKQFFYLYKENKNTASQVIKNTKDAINLITPLLSDKPHEELYLVCIDGVNNVKKLELISKGVSNATSVNIRKITETIISTDTHNAIICHNHPEGESSPSVADDKLTRSLFMGLIINNINLLDHIIIGKNDYYSYNISGKIKHYYNEFKDLINADALNQNACEYNKN